MLRNLLIYRMLIVNALLFVLVGWGAATGYIQKLVDHDTPELPAAMVALFLVGLLSTAIRSTKVSSGLNRTKGGDIMELMMVKADIPKMAIKNAHIGAIGSWLVTLGLIGNIVGFTMAVSQMDLSGGPDQAMAAISQMIVGMKFAFNNTLIGTALGLWTLINYQFLSTATALLEKDAGHATR